MSEVLIELEIVPIEQTYENEEIVYRIFFNKQLIVERSYPKIPSSSYLLDSFHADIQDNSDNLLELKNCKDKLVKVRKVKLNDLKFDLPYKSLLLRLNNYNLKIIS
jgi:hypothetical protein